MTLTKCLEFVGLTTVFLDVPSGTNFLALLHKPQGPEWELVGVVVALPVTIRIYGTVLALSEMVTIVKDNGAFLSHHKIKPLNPSHCMIIWADDRFRPAYDVLGGVNKTQICPAINYFGASTTQNIIQEGEENKKGKGQNPNFQTSDMSLKTSLELDILHSSFLPQY